MKLTLCFVISLMLFAQSCEKEPGLGGRASIEGKVIVNEYNEDLTQILHTHEAQREDVYIIYGDKGVYSDRFKTNFDGKYRFPYLRKGLYTVFVYSEDVSTHIPMPDKVLRQEVEIVKEGQVVELKDFVIDNK